MLNIYHSNKIEVLAKQLAALLHFNPLPPLVSEQIVVESSAMQQWLTQYISKDAGVAANIHFPFPSALVWNIYRLQMPILAKKSSFDRPALLWRLYELFAQHDFFDKYPEFSGSALEKYLQQLTDQQQLMQFVEQISRLYDQYQIYRPDWLVDWQSGGEVSAESSPWQAQLWRLLCELEPEQESRASVFQQSMARFPLAEKQAQQVAHRLNIFAVSTMAKSYLDLFAELAKTIDINIFLLNPCSVYWGDIQSEKQALKSSALDESLQGSNELLALLAKQNRDFVHILQEYDSAQHERLFVDDCPSEGATLLQYVQQDILLLRQNSPLHEINISDKRLLASNDKSIKIHSCHSPLREVQVLHNEILEFVQNNPGMALDDIAIMVPNLETYIPCFQAVFASAEKGCFLPFHIAERQSLQNTGIQSALLQLLRLPSGQFKREDILLLIQEPTLAARFSLTQQQLITRLLDELQVRFALTDDAWFSMFPSAANNEDKVSFSWQQAKQRLLASFAMAEEAQWSLHETIAGIEEDTAVTAGFLCTFIDALMQAYLPQSQTILGWRDYINRLLDQFFIIDDESERQQLRDIRAALEQLCDDVAQAKFSQTIEPDIFLQQFEAALQQGNSSHYFKPAVINIATLLPMRTIAFKKIAVLGLNDGEFPRPANTDQLDLMVHHPRPGDRNRREEDRYLFLETLLASRQSCHFSFMGNSHIDNSERYPSLLLAELIKHINAHYYFDGCDEIEERLVIKHALQVFDAKYFHADDAQYFSFNQNALQQAKALEAQAKISPAFLTNNPMVGNVLNKALSIHECTVALKDPSRFFMRNMGIADTRFSHEEESIENFSADALQSYQALHLVLDKPQITAKMLCRLGLIAQGKAGEIEFQRIGALANNIHQQCQRHYLKVLDERSLISVVTERHDITGELGGFNTTFNQRLAWRGRKLHGGHLIQAWFEHLLCQLSLGCVNSFLIEEKASYKISSIEHDEAERLLVDLLHFIEQAQQGLSWFFPKSCWDYMQVSQKKSAEAGLQALEKSLLGNKRLKGEFYTPANQCVYRGLDDIPFEMIAEQAENLFSPLFDYFQLLPKED